MLRKAICISFVILLCLPAIASADPNWPQWRGPAGTGAVAEDKVPVKWSAADVQFRVELPGRGQSSPVIWGDKIFLTAASEKGDRMVMCLSRKDGSTLWQKTVSKGKTEELHKMNTWASATCATDGKHVAAFFGRGGLHCFNVDGELLWSKDLGEFAGPWGTGASPIMVGDLVVQNCDADNAAFLVAFDKHSGKEVWRTGRPVVRGWSTPVLIEAAGRKELVMNGHTGVTGYDPETGKQLWFCKGDNGRGTPTVTPAAGLMVAVAGRPGDMVAVKAGGAGNVKEVWRTPRRSGRDLPSPAAVGDFLFVANMRGIGSIYDARTGQLLNTMRLTGNYSASPVVAGGLIYQPEETGDVVVIKAGKQPEIVARNSVNAEDNESFRASLAVVDGQIFMRSTHALYCVGKAKK